MNSGVSRKRTIPANIAWLTVVLTLLFLGGMLQRVMYTEIPTVPPDRVTPPADCAERARLFGASFSLIARAGHASTVEQATALAAAIARDARRSTVAGIDHD